MGQLKGEGGRVGVWPAEPSSAADPSHSDHQ